MNESSKGRARNRIEGCLLGGAVGDAMGAPVEFLPLSGIRSRFGFGGVQDISDVLDEASLARITDDTQMTLFTAEGLLRAMKREREKGIGGGTVPVIHHSYIRWLHTQGVKADHDRYEANEDDGWLITNPGLHARRAPGNTCLSALMSGRMGTITEPINDSKGCGGVMRAAPVGFLYLSGRAFSLGCEVAAITHGHPSGFLAAGCLSSIVSDINRGKSLDEAITGAVGMLVEKPGHEECLESVQRAVSLASDSSIPAAPETVESLGEGWVAEEALAMALYCAIVAEDDFAEGIRLAINHGGDSDSTGSITGNILGALLGRNAIPTGWIDKLELRAEMEKISRDMEKALSSGDISWDDYPGW